MTWVCVFGWIELEYCKQASRGCIYWAPFYLEEDLGSHLYMLYLRHGENENRWLMSWHSAPYHRKWPEDCTGSRELRPSSSTCICPQMRKAACFVSVCMDTNTYKELMGWVHIRELLGLEIPAYFQKTLKERSLCNIDKRGMAVVKSWICNLWRKLLHFHGTSYQCMLKGNTLCQSGN